MSELELRRLINRARLHVASWVLGPGWYGAIMRLQLIHDRAERTVSRDGRVTLAECKALAEALYEHIPGQWRLTVERVEERP